MRSLRDSMRVCAFAAPLLLLVPMLLAGCGGSPTLAQVGSHKITVADFEDAGRTNGMQYPGTPDSAKGALLDDLVKRALMLEQAARLKIVPDSTMQRVQKQAADRLAVQGLMQKLVPTDVPVSDAETQALYKQRGTEGHLFLIFTPDEGQAKQAAQDIAKGEPFAAVAGRINNPAVLKADGDLGFQQSGAMVSPMDEWVGTAPLNQLMGPVPAPGFGYFLGKVTERRPKQQGPYELEKSSLTQMLHMKKMRALQQKAYNDMRDQYRIKVEGGGAQAMFTRLQRSNPDLAKGMGAQTLPPTPTPADATTVLAHYEGADGKTHDYTMADALKDLTDPASPRIDPSSVPVLRQWIETVLVQHALRIEAERRHMSEEPDVQRRAREQVDNEVLQRVYAQQIATRVAQPSAADVQAAFQRHAASLVRLDAVKLLVATTPDSAAALQLMSGAVKQGSLRKAAPAIPGVHLAEKDLHYPTQDGYWLFQQGNLMGAKEGDSRGPFRAPGGWIVYEVESKQQTTRTLETLEPQYRQALEQEAAEMARDRILGHYTDSLRTAIGVKTYPDRLKRIVWPVPPKV